MSEQQVVRVNYGAGRAAVSMPKNSTNEAAAAYLQEHFPAERGAWVVEQTEPCGIIPGNTRFTLSFPLVD